MGISTIRIDSEYDKEDEVKVAVSRGMFIPMGL